MINEGAKIYGTSRDRIKGVYYASEMYECERKLYYAYNYKVEHDFETKKNFEIGNSLHNLVQGSLMLYAKNNPEIKLFNELEDLKIIDDENGYEIHGRLDTIIYGENESNHIIEFKTTGSLNRINNPVNHHIEQINYYLHFFPKYEGHLIYINKKPKGSLKKYENFKEFRGITYNDAMFKADIEKVKNVNYKIKNNILPEPEAKLKKEKNWECWYCPFRQKCDNNEN